MDMQIKCPLSYLFGCCLYLFDALLLAQPANVMIDKGIPGNRLGPCEPSLAINPRNTMQMAAGAILDRYYWTEDGGSTWQRDTLRSTYGVYGDPVLLADTNGHFYYAHLSDPDHMGWASSKLLDRIVVQKSTDGGRTYDNGTYVGLRTPKDQDKQWLGLDPRSNAILCTWTEFDLYNSPDPSDKSRILFSMFDPGGSGWSEPIAINQFEGDCADDDYTTEGAVPAAGPEGQLYVAWAWHGRIWFDRSLDGGKTWLKKDIVAARQPGGWHFDIPGIQRCNGMPVLVCDLSNGPNRGNLYINWTDQRRGEHDTDVWLVSSTNGGKTWSKPMRVNNDPPGRHQFFSWMAVDQTNGYLYIVFYDRRAYDDLRTDVYLAVSKDGGKTFTNEKISETPFTPNRYVFFGDYNHISAHGGTVRPIWTRLENGILSVWTALYQEKDGGR